MEFIILTLISALFLALLYSGLNILAFKLLVLIVFTLILNIILYKKLFSYKSININIFLLKRYNYSAKWFLVLIMSYLAFISLLTFILPTHPSLWWLPVSELLPSYKITFPIIAFFINTSPIFIFTYFVLKFFLFKSLLNEFKIKIYHIVPLLFLDSLYFPIIRLLKNNVK